MTWTLDKWKFLRENAATMTRRELAEAMGVSYSAISTKCYELGIKTKDAEPTWLKKMKEAKAKRAKQEKEPEPERLKPTPSAPQLTATQSVRPVKLTASEQAPVKERTTPLTWGGYDAGEKPYEFQK